MQHVARHELDTGLLKPKQEMSVAGQPIKARDDELRVEDAARGERFCQGWPIVVSLTALDLDEGPAAWRAGPVAS